MSEASPPAQPSYRRPAAIGCLLVTSVSLCLLGLLGQYVYFHSSGLVPGGANQDEAPPRQSGDGEGGGCEFPPFS